jgi:hypothetical protein
MGHIKVTKNLKTSGSQESKNPKKIHYEPYNVVCSLLPHTSFDWRVFNKKNPFKAPFQCHITCSNQKSFGLFFEFKWLGVKIQVWFLIILLAIIFLSHNSKWHMWTHFSYFCFKTFPIVYWGPNLDHIYYVHFCLKNTRPPMELQFPKCLSLECVWIPKQFSLASIFMC